MSDSNNVTYEIKNDKVKFWCKYFSVPKVNLKNSYEKGN